MGDSKVSCCTGPLTTTMYAKHRGPTTDYTTYCWWSSRADKGMGAVCLSRRIDMSPRGQRPGMCPCRWDEEPGANRVELHEWFGVWRNDGT